MDERLIRLEESFEKRIDSLSSKLDKLVDTQSDIRADLQEHKGRLDIYNSLLDIHIKRSESLETMVKELYKYKYYIVGALTVGMPMLTWGLEILKTWILK